MSEVKVRITVDYEFDTENQKYIATVSAMIDKPLPKIMFNNKVSFFDFSLNSSWGHLRYGSKNEPDYYIATIDFRNEDLGTLIDQTEKYVLSQIEILRKVVIENKAKIAELPSRRESVFVIS